MKSAELIAYLNTYLRIPDIQDYGPQGLQVEAETTEITRIALAVDVSPAIIEAAAAWQAQMLIVHHGILWGKVELIAGPLGERVRLLLRHNIHLYAAHLPLDAHPEVGNNAVLARQIGLEEVTAWCNYKGTPIGMRGVLPEPRPVAEIVAQLNRELPTEVVAQLHGSQLARHVGIISGYGIGHLAEAVALGVDTFITGEKSHSNYWHSADYRANVLYAGHYASETVGVKALGQHLTEKFGLTVHFLDFPTGM